MLVVGFRELQFWQDTDNLSNLLAAPFRVKPNGCIGLTVGDGGGSCAGQHGDCTVAGEVGL